MKRATAIVGRFQKWMFCSDLHGQLQHKSTVEACLKFKKAFDPDITIFGGDLFDLRALLRRATEEDRSVSIKDDVDAGMLFIRQLDPDVWLWGNHDFRLNNLAMSRDARSADLAGVLLSEINDECGDRKITQIPWGKRHGVYRLGHLTFSHGYASGIGAARKMALVYGNVIFGHNHAIDCVSIETHSHVTGRCAGCLCELDLDYNLGQLATLRQAHGWAYGVTNTVTGEYFALQSQNVNGTWFCPCDFSL